MREAHPEASPLSELPKSGRPLRGIHVLGIALAAFAVILGANIAMISAATGSFPGVVAKNSYVASQEFNAKAAERARLGWKLTVGYADGLLRLDARDADGEILRGLAVAAEVGLSVDGRTDREVALSETAEGYAASIDLKPGQWRVKILAAAPSGDSMDGAAIVQVR